MTLRQQVDQAIASVEKTLTQMDNVEAAARALLDDVAKRHKVTSPDGFRCESMKALAKACQWLPLAAKDDRKIPPGAVQVTDFDSLKVGDLVRRFLEFDGKFVDGVLQVDLGSYWKVRVVQGPKNQDAVFPIDVFDGRIFLLPPVAAPKRAPYVLNGQWIAEPGDAFNWTHPSIAGPLSRTRQRMVGPFVVKERFDQLTGGGRRSRYHLIDSNGEEAVSEYELSYGSWTPVAAEVLPRVVTDFSELRKGDLVRTPGAEGVLTMLYSIEKDHVAIDTGFSYWAMKVTSGSPENNCCDAPDVERGRVTLLARG